MDTAMRAIRCTVGNRQKRYDIKTVHSTNVLYVTMAKNSHTVWTESFMGQNFRKLFIFMNFAKKSFAF